MPVSLSSSSGKDFGPIALSYSVNGELRWSKEWKESPFKKGTVIDWRTGLLKTPLYDPESEKPVEVEYEKTVVHYPQWHTTVYALDEDHKKIAQTGSDSVVTSEEPIGSEDESDAASAAVSGYLIEVEPGVVYRLNDDYRPAYADAEFKKDGEIYGGERITEDDLDNDDDPSGIYTDVGWHELPPSLGADRDALNKISFEKKYVDGVKLEIDKGHKSTLYAVFYVYQDFSETTGGFNLGFHLEIVSGLKLADLENNSFCAELHVLSKIEYVAPVEEDESGPENPLVPFKVTQLEDSAIQVLVDRVHWVTRPVLNFAPLFRDPDDPKKDFYLGLDVQDHVTPCGYHSTVVKFIKLKKDQNGVLVEERPEEPPECGHPGNKDPSDDERDTEIGGGGGGGLDDPRDLEDSDPEHETPSPSCGSPSSSDESSSTTDPPLE